MGSFRASIAGHICIKEFYSRRLYSWHVVRITQVPNVAHYSHIVRLVLSSATRGDKLSDVPMDLP